MKNAPSALYALALLGFFLPWSSLSCSVPDFESGNTQSIKIIQSGFSMITGNASLKVNGKTPSEEERQGMNMQQDEGPDQAWLLILFPLGLLAGIGLCLSKRLTPAGIAGIVAIVAAMLQLALGFPLENIQPGGGNRDETGFPMGPAMGQLQQPAEPTLAGVPRAHRSSPPSDGLQLTLVQLEGTAPELEPAAPAEEQVPLELESGQDPEDTEIFDGEVTAHTIDETDDIEVHVVQPELNGSGMEETEFSVTEDFDEMDDMMGDAMGDAMGDMMMSQAFEKKVEPFFWISNLAALVGAVLCFVVANQIKPTSVPQPSTPNPQPRTLNPES